MKNLYTKNEFLNNRENELINEGIFQFIGNMFNKAKTYINKVKGGNEVDKIYNKYLQIIQNEFSKKAQVNLNILAANKVKKEEKKEQKQQPNQQNQQPNQQNQQQNQQPNQQQVSAKTESILNEEVAAQPDTKLNIKTLKAKQQTITKILNFYQDKALKEMDAVLKRLGGAEKNKDLAIYIDSKKDEFKLAFLSAEIEAYNQGGDKVAANKLAIERTNLTKQINNKLKNLGKKDAPLPEQTAPEQKQAQAPAPEQKQAPEQTGQQIPRYDKLTDEQKTKYQELKKAWIEKQKQEGKNTKPGQGTRDSWYKQVGEKQGEVRQ